MTVSAFVSLRFSRAFSCRSRWIVSACDEAGLRPRPGALAKACCCPRHLDNVEL